MLKLKQTNGWFAAGREVGRAIEVLSDGAFKLFVYLCLQASRDTARLAVNDGDLAGALKKSRRSIITYLHEMQRQGVCRIDSALNQHQSGEIEICDAFWPYHKPAAPAVSADVAYIREIRTLLAARRCVEIAFTPADEKLAAALFAERIPLEHIERAILLACTRKCVALLNGQVSGPITSLHYFRGPIDEVGRLEVGSEYWRYLKFRLKPLEVQWLEQQRQIACANFSQANEESRETK